MVYILKKGWELSKEDLQELEEKSLIVQYRSEGGGGGGGGGVIKRIGAGGGGRENSSVEKKNRYSSVTRGKRGVPTTTNEGGEKRKIRDYTVKRRRKKG